MNVAGGQGIPYVALQDLTPNPFQPEYRTNIPALGCP